MRRAPAFVLALVAAGTGAGCLERRIVVTSDPEGAVVWLNDQEVGRTPVETGFQFYGVYDVRLRKEGYEPLATKQKAKSPWYEYPGPDLIAAALPFTIRKTVRWHYELTPLPEGTPEDRDELVQRAEEFRSGMTPTEGPR